MPYTSNHLYRASLERRQETRALEQAIWLAIGSAAISFVPSYRILQFWTISIVRRSSLPFKHVFSERCTALQLFRNIYCSFILMCIVHDIFAFVIFHYELKST